MKYYIYNIYLYFLSSILLANTLLVPEDFNSIQLAIDNSISGDTILVNSGIYTENIIISNLSLFLISVDGPNDTVIDGNYNGSTININSPSDSILIKGFIIKNGIGEFLDSGSRFGGGIISNNTMVTLDSVIIENNESFAGGGICFYNMDSIRTNSILKNSVVQNNISSEGGGIFIINQSLDIVNSVISNNGMIPYGSGGGIQGLLSDINIVATSIENNHSRFGGGIYIANCQANISNSIISDNLSDSKGGGIWVGNESELELLKTLISDNFSDGFGGGIFISFSDIEINQSTLVSNLVSSNVSGAGIYADGGNAIIQNSIIYFNRIEENNSINHNLDGYSANYLNEYNVEYSDIEGDDNWIPDGIGVISSNPQFEENSYYLLESSPCIDSGNPNYLDLDSTVVDMGAYYYNQDFCNIGDLNEDNIINVLDIIFLVNIILDSNISYNLCNDVNNDDEVNVLDIVYLIQIIINIS